jgi:hypothetical protein
LSPERELTLLACRTRAQRESALEHTQRVGETVDWDLLTAQLAARRLLPQLGPRIAADTGSAAPERFTAAVATAITRTRRQSALLMLAGARITAALSDAGVASMTIKGTALAEDLYGDSGRRPAGDIDLLVHEKDLRRAVDVALEQGYEPPEDPVDRDGLPLLHQSLRHSADRLPPLELHWRVHWYERRFAAAMLARAEPRAGEPGLQPRREDQLACLLLCFARDGFQGLRLACDLSAWWDRFAGSLPAGGLVPIAREHPSLAPALTAASVAAERLAGLPAERVLAPRRSRATRVRLAARLADPGIAGGPDQSRADAGLVDWLLTPAGGHAAFVRRQLLPPRAVLAGRSRATGERRLTPAGHGLRVLGRYGLSVLRHAHSRPFSAPTSISSIRS